jgi:hypothetical protein
MKLFLLVLILFLLAFAGLAAGLILRRRGLRGACGSAKTSTHDCRCESELDRSMQAQSNCHKK